MFLITEFIKCFFSILFSILFILFLIYYNILLFYVLKKNKTQKENKYTVSNFKKETECLKRNCTLFLLD